MATFSLDGFVEEIKQARMDADGQAAVEEVLRCAVSDPSAIVAELGEPEEADLHKLYSDEDVTILHVIWPPLISLLPHNHNLWASIGIYTGRENNIVWKRTDEVIEATGASALSAKDVYRLPEDAIRKARYRRMRTGSTGGTCGCGARSLLTSALSALRLA